jgi:hypothetical protein
MSSFKKEHPLGKILYTWPSPCCAVHCRALCRLAFEVPRKQVQVRKRLLTEAGEKRIENLSDFFIWLLRYWFARAVFLIR